MATRDWVDWHRGYDDPDSKLTWRLEHIQRRIRDLLDRAPPGRIKVASLCAGDGRDLLDVVVDHPRANDVEALLVEQDPELSNRARQRALTFGAQIQVITGDASTTDTFIDFVPVDLVLLCGIFGNITDEDIAHTVQTLPGFCQPGATVIWTRRRRLDLVPTIRQWFAEAGFAEDFTESSAAHGICVAGHRYTGPEIELPAHIQLFQFR